MRIFEFVRDRVAWIAIALYVVSMALPIFYLGSAGEEPSTQWGFAGLLLGWAAPMVDGVFSWYANPLFWLALLLWCRPLLSAIALVGALALALSFLGVEQMSADEAGHMADVLGYGPGYYLWLAALGVALCRQAYRRVIARTSTVAAQ